MTTPKPLTEAEEEALLESAMHEHAARDYARVCAELEAARAALWTCPDCAFSFAAEHADADGGHSCPACAELRLAADLAAARSELEACRRERDEARDAVQAACDATANAVTEASAQEVADLLVERDEALAQVAALKDMFERDATGLATALLNIRKHAEGYAWITQGRGSYEWNDDRFFEEAGHALRPIIEMAKAAYPRSAEAIRLLANTAEAAKAHDATVAEKARRPLLDLLKRWRDGVNWMDDSVKADSLLTETRAALTQPPVDAKPAASSQFTGGVKSDSLDAGGWPLKEKPAAKCATCGGWGGVDRHEPGDSADRCPDCGGTGRAT